jgi:Ribonuclease G/E
VEAEYLKKLYLQMLKKAESAPQGALLHQDDELPVRTMRDSFGDEIVAMHVDESIFDENGKMPVESIGLLAYAHGHYLSVKRKPIGRFGYSVMKAKTKKRLNREAHQERVEKNRARREKRGAAGSGRPANKSKKK